MSEPAKPIFRFLIHWVLCNMVGYAVGFFAGFLLGHAILGNLAVGLGIGVGVAVAQALVLQSRISSRRRWFLAAIFGHGTAHAGLAIQVWAAGTPADLSWPAGIAMWGVTIAMGGTITACLQSTLFASALRYPWGWIAINTIIWSASVLGLAIPPDLSGGWSSWMIPMLILRNGLLAPAVAGLILGVLSSVYWIVDRQSIAFRDTRPEKGQNSYHDLRAAIPPNG